MDIVELLYEHQDIAYRDFQAPLLPTVDRTTFIGVRTPVLKKLAKELIRSGEALPFMNHLPHTYFEENQLHALILCELKDYEEVLARVQAFLPYVDNWATCDQLRPKVFAKNKESLIAEIRNWIRSKETYTVRFGIGMMMCHFLDDTFRPEYLEEIAVLRSDEYYVNMMLAWFFATALAKQYEATIPYLIEGRLDTWVHNKTISKARESFRVTAEQKEYLKLLRKQ